MSKSRRENAALSPGPGMVGSHSRNLRSRPFFRRVSDKGGQPGRKFNAVFLAVTIWMG